MANKISLLSIFIVLVGVAIIGVGCSSSKGGNSGIKKPLAPANLTVTAGYKQASLSWSASTGAISYDISDSTVSGGPYTKVDSTAGQSYTVTGLTNGTKYYFVVTAVNNINEESVPSNEAGVTLKSGAPVNLTASAGNTKVTLNWNSSLGAGH